MMGPCHQSCQPPSSLLLPTSRFYALSSPALPSRLRRDKAVMVADKLDFPLCALICRLQQITIIFNELSRACMPKEDRMFETFADTTRPLLAVWDWLLSWQIIDSKWKKGKSIVFISTVRIREYIDNN